MVNTKQLLSIGAFLVAAILLVFVVTVMIGPNLAWVPDPVSGTSGDDNPLGQPSDSTPVSSPTPISPSFVEINQTTITPDSTGAVRIGLNNSTVDYSSIRMTLSVRRDEVAGIQDVRSAGVGNFEVVEENEESMTFEIDRINSARETIARMSVEGRSVGSTSIIAQMRVFSDSSNETTNLTLSKGEVTVEPFTPNVTVRGLSVTHTDQPQFGKTVTVRRVTLPDGGFVVLYNRTDDGSVGDEMGHSSYLEPGVQTNVPVTLDRLIRNDREMTARIQYDKDNDQLWDGNRTDTKFPSSDGGVTTDNATLSVQFVTHVDVTLTDATDGLQKYRIELATPSDSPAIVSEVTPDHITGTNVAVIGGGPGDSHVEVQGVDVDNQVEPSSDNTTLLTVAFESEEQLDRDQLAVRSLDVEDDDGDRISREDVTTEIRCYSPFNGSVAGQPRYGEPTDPDCDGLFEDVDGDGRLTSNDVQALAFIKDANLTDEQVDALDFNGNGTLEFGDIDRLEDEIQQDSDPSTPSSAADISWWIVHTLIKDD